MSDALRPTHGGTHPDDDELLALAVDVEPGLDDVAVADGDHVRMCASCGARLQALQAWLQQIEIEAVADADAAFPASRLAAQRDEIMRKLEAAAANGRVIPFPAAPTHAIPALAFQPRRWLAAAAAAGLIVGLLTGRLLWDEQRPSPRDSSRSAALQRQTPAPRIERALAHPADELFLSEVELAIQSPPVAELQAIDALTPRMRQ